MIVDANVKSVVIAKPMGNKKQRRKKRKKKDDLDLLEDLNYNNNNNAVTKALPSYGKG